MAASSDSFSSNCTNLIVPVLLAVGFAGAPEKGFDFAYSSRSQVEGSQIAFGIRCGGGNSWSAAEKVQE